MGDEVVTTPYGKFFVDPEDCIGGTLKAGTIWDGPGFLQVVLKDYTTVGTTVIDIGANFGSFTVYCASKGYKVIAVEPMPETLRYLRATLDLNQASCADKVILLPFAAYDNRCYLTNRDFVPHNFGSPSLVPILLGEISNEQLEAAPLDDYRMLFGTVGLIKVDAQGCDAAALHGLSTTIRKQHPVIVFEWEEDMATPHGYTLEHTLAWLVELGYQVIQWPSHRSNYLAVWGTR
jgi:FkbM family methyltransferase